MVILGYLVARFVSSETFLQMVGVANTSQGGRAHPEGGFPHDSLILKEQLARGVYEEHAMQGLPAGASLHDILMM